MISKEDLSIRMYDKVQEVPGKKGLLTKYLWKLLKNLFIDLLFQIIKEEYEKRKAMDELGIPELGTGLPIKKIRVTTFRP